MASHEFALLPVWYVAFLLSITCHEAAHALAAKLGGDPTAYAAGQVTLNPLPHIRREPTGTVLIPLLSFFLSGWMMGWASAPFDPYWQQRYPRRAAWMALAGPAANLALVLLSGLLIILGYSLRIFTQPESVSFEEIVTAGPGAAAGMAAFLSVLFSLNVILMVFNLLPIPPLDGASAIGIVLPERVTVWFAGVTRNPMISLLGIVIAWNIAGHIIWPVFFAALRLLYSSLR